MIREDEEALICDLAETYNIYDYKSYSATFIATLAVGLRANSRIKLKLTKQKVDLKELLLAATLDKVNLLFWAQTKDGQKGIRQPESVALKLLGEKENNYEQYMSAHDFEKERQRIMKGGINDRNRDR